MIGNVFIRRISLLTARNYFKPFLAPYQRLIEKFPVFNLGISTVNRFSSKNETSKEFKKGSQPQNDGKQDIPNDFPKIIALFSIMLFNIVLLLRSQQKLSQQPQTKLAKEELRDLIETNQILKIFLPSYIKGYESLGKIVILLNNDRKITLNGQNPEMFERNLRRLEFELGIQNNQQIQIEYYSLQDFVGISTIFSGGLLLVIGYFFFKILARRMQNFKFDMFGSFSDTKFTLHNKEITKGISMKSVAGLAEAKLEVMEFVDYLSNPERYARLGAKVPKGALLLGPPGTGKTLLAKAVAAEASVPFLYKAGPEFVEVVGGLGAARVRDLFKSARKHSPCILYIDEVDAIGKKRSESTRMGGSDEMDQTLNQLLVELDGLDSGNEGVLFLASTNRADVLDKALLRPGRLDRHIYIDLPTLLEREEIFNVHLGALQMGDLNKNKCAKWMSELTAGLSGADIAGICNEAALIAGRKALKVVNQQCLEEAVERTIGGLASRKSLGNDRRAAAIHEAGITLVGWMLEGTDIPKKISVVPRAGGGLQRWLVRGEHVLVSEETLQMRMTHQLGGRAAEMIIFNRQSTLSETELQKVTKNAYDQVLSYGMNKNVGPIAFTESEIRPYSNYLQQLVDTEAARLVSDCYKRAYDLLIQHKSIFLKLAERLEQEEVLSYQQVKDILGPPPYSHEFDSATAN